MSFAPVHTTGLHAMPSDKSDGCAFMGVVDSSLRKVGISGSGIRSALTPEEKQKLLDSGAIISIAPPIPEGVRVENYERANNLRVWRRQRNNRILELHHEGLNDAEVAEKVGCGLSTVGEVLIKLIGKRTKPMHVKKLRAELDAIRAKKKPGESDHACSHRIGIYTRFVYLRTLELKGKI